MLDNYLTTEQVAKILQVHPFTILKFIKSGKIKGVKLGRVYRINENDVKDFLENMSVGSTQRKHKENKEEKVYELSEPTEDKEVYII